VHSEPTINQRLDGMATDEPIPARQEYGILHQSTVGTNPVRAKLHRRSVTVIAGICAFATLSCTPSYPTPGGIAVTGNGAPGVTAQDRRDIDERLRRVRVCFRDNGFPIRGNVEEVRVHVTTCKQPKFRKGTHWVYGYSNEEDRIEVDYRLIEVEHEGAAVYYRDHGPLDHSDPEHPSMVCGEPLKRAWFREHPRPACRD
jgi:hypothetical protein